MTMKPGILIVDDEVNMRIGLRDNLEFEGYRVDEADNGVTGLDLIIKNQYDLVLLDVMMPGMSGLDVCRKARAANVQTPIVLLTAKGEELDKVIGLELGADDYVTKPFSVRELMARIKAILRRGTPQASDQTEWVAIGKLKVNFNAYTAQDASGAVRMSYKEYGILHLLLHRKNEVVTRDELLQQVWGYDDTPTTRTVDNFIVKLRHKIEEDPNDPKIIITVHGLGYKFISPS